MKNFIFYLSIISVITMSCTNESNNRFISRSEQDSIKTIKLYNKNKVVVEPDSILEIIKYIKLETSKESLIGNIYKMRSYGDTLFILDKFLANDQILAFNFDGKFLFKIDDHGRGPNEFLDIDDFYVDQHSRQIGILSRSNIYKYDFSGDFISKLDLHEYYIRNIEYKDNKLYVYKSSNSKSENFAFAVFDMKGNLIYEDYLLENDIISYELHKQEYLAGNSGNIYLNLLNSDTIYRVGENSLIPCYFLDFGKYKLPEVEFKKLVSKRFEYSHEYFEENEYARFGLSRFITTNDFMYLSFDTKQYNYSTLYSFKTGNSKTFNSWHPTSELLFSASFHSLNSDFFYGTISAITIVNYYRKVDEYDGILDPDKEFSERRRNKYNLIKDIVPEDNDIIVIFKFKEF